MFEDGFLETGAPMYMDIITLYFGLLPLLMGSAILLAVQKKYELHYKAQVTIFVITLLVVGLFEVGVRVSGGFSAFMQESNAHYTFMIVFLVIHIIIALISVVLYSLLIYSAVSEYRLHNTPVVKSHKKLARVVYIGMTMTSLTGVMIYYLLFVF